MIDSKICQKCIKVEGAHFSSVCTTKPMKL